MRGANQTEMLEKFEKKGDSSSQVRLFVCLQGGGGGGGGYSDIFICWPGLIFRVQNFEFQHFGVFSENWIFLGNEDFVDIFWDHHKIRLYLEVISMNFYGSFLKVKVQTGGYFLGCSYFKYLFGVLEIPDIFLG